MNRTGLLMLFVLCILSMSSFAETYHKVSPQNNSQPNTHPIQTPPVIETVIVQATRSQDPLHSLALSASVIDSETLRSQNADHPSELLNLVPGVNLHRGSGAEHLTAIRSPVLTGGAGAGSFLYLLNGIPLRSAGFANVNGLFDAPTALAKQIEIIKGPSGPIYGANAVHGVINVVMPEAIEDINQATLSADSLERYKGHILFSQEHENHAWLTGLSVIDENGYRDDASLSQQKGLIRHKTTLSEISVDTWINIHNLNQDTAGFIFGKATLADKALRRGNEFPFAYRDARSVQIQTRISHTNTSNLQFQVTPYVRWHDMEFLQHFLPSQAIETTGHRSIGAQSDIHFTWNNIDMLSGIDLEYTQGELKEFQTLPTIFSYTQGLHYDYDVTSNSASVFTQAAYPITDTIKLHAGIRFDHTRYDYDNRTDSNTVGRFLRIDDQQNNFFTSSPKVNIEYHPSSTLTAYISWARANRPPQTSDLYRKQINQIDDNARPEKMDAFELGLRSNHENLSYHMALYSMKKTGYFFRDSDGFNVNNGITQHQGIELDIVYYLSKNLSLQSAVSYAKHTYLFDREVNRDYNTIRQGNDVDTAPRKMMNTRFSWKTNDKLSLEAHWTYMSEYYTDAANLHKYGGHNTFNFQAKYAITSNTHVTLSIKNLTDKLYAERADYAFGQERFFPAETRNFSLSFERDFSG